MIYASKYRINGIIATQYENHDDVIKWRYFPRNWPFVRGIPWSPVNSPHKGQWRGAFMLSLICTRINGWVNNREAGDLRRYPAHYDVNVMCHHRRHMLSKRVPGQLPFKSWKHLAHYWPLCGEFTGFRWFLPRRGPVLRICGLLFC